MVVNSLSNVRHVSLRLSIEIDVVFGFGIGTKDVAQTYLQSERVLMPNVYIKAVKRIPAGTWSDFGTVKLTV